MRPNNPACPFTGQPYVHQPSGRVGVVTHVRCAGRRERRYRYVYAEIRDGLGVMDWKSNLETFWRSWRSA